MRSVVEACRAWSDGREVIGGCGKASTREERSGRSGSIVSGVSEGESGEKIG